MPSSGYPLTKHGILKQDYESSQDIGPTPGAEDAEPAVREEAKIGPSQRALHIRIKNRRRSYLDRHPSYFESPDLELADPLLYDRCVRRFQSAAEREAEGRSKGYSGVLEADLYRSEAKLVALQNLSSPSNQPQDYSSNQITYMRGPDGQILPEDPDEIPADREEGLERWKYEMTMRFLKGEDLNFPYPEVDETDELDIIEIREAEDRWFDDEEPQFTNDEQSRHGDTGIQDF